MISVLRTLPPSGSLTGASIVVDRDTGRGLPGLEGPANHDGGGMAIYRNQLYISVGDTGANATPPLNKYGTCLNKPNGKMG